MLDFRFLYGGLRFVCYGINAMRIKLTTAESLNRKNAFCFEEKESIVSLFNELFT